MNRPPPYFPQNQLSPPDEKRYRRLKVALGAAITLALALLAVAGYGIYMLIRWLIA